VVKRHMSTVLEADVGWDEWGTVTIGVHAGRPYHLSQIWVSGCRLFCIVPDNRDDEGNEPSFLQIYDFSHAGRAKYLHTLDRASEGGGARQISASLDGYKLPWNIFDFGDVLSTTGHDSILFCIDQDPQSDPEKQTLHVWSL